MWLPEKCRKENDVLAVFSMLISLRHKSEAKLTRIYCNVRVSRDRKTFYSNLSPYALHILNIMMNSPMRQKKKRDQVVNH